MAAVVLLALVHAATSVVAVLRLRCGVLLLRLVAEMVGDALLLLSEDDIHFGVVAFDRDEAILDQEVEGLAEQRAVHVLALEALNGVSAPDHQVANRPVHVGTTVPRPDGPVTVVVEDASDATERRADLLAGEGVLLHLRRGGSAGRLGVLSIRHRYALSSDRWKVRMQPLSGR